MLRVKCKVLSIFRETSKCLTLFSDSCTFRFTRCERRRRWAGRRPDFVRKTMPEPRRGSQLGPNCINSLVRRRRTSSDNLLKNRCNSLLALKFAYGAPSLLSSGTKLRGSSTLNVGSSSNALWAPPTALRATMAFESPRALRGCMVFKINSL